MKKIKWMSFTSFLLLCISQNTFALEVDRDVMPRVTIFGRILGTLDGVHFNSNPDKRGEINIDDSTIITRFDKHLFQDQGVAGGVVGFKESDDVLKFHQLHVFFWNKCFEAKIGRTNLPNTLIEFPILRDEDLLAYTHIGNGSSNLEFDQRYGRILSGSWIFDQKIQKLYAFTGMMRSDGTNVNAPNGLDYYGIGYDYHQPESLRFVKWLRHIGISLQKQKVNIPSSPLITLMNNKWMTQVIAGAHANLNSNPIQNWSFAVQGIYNRGIGIPLTLDHPTQSVSNQAQSNSRAMIASLQYVSRPNLLSKWQAGLTFAYKDYHDVSSGHQWSIVPSFVYGLGRGIDLLGQIRYTKYGDALYQGGSDTLYQIGMSMNLETVWNDQIGERASIMNLEHHYIQ